MPAMAPRPAPPTFEEAGALTMRIYQVADLARADFTAVVGALGLTSLQARVLLQLKEPLPMREVAELLSCDPSNVTGIADRLASAGLVERVEGQDRRVKLLRLTPAGLRLRAQVAEHVAWGATAAKLDKTERAQLTALLDKLLE